MGTFTFMNPFIFLYFIIWLLFIYFLFLVNYFTMTTRLVIAGVGLIVLPFLFFSYLILTKQYEGAKFRISTNFKPTVSADPNDSNYNQNSLLTPKAVVTKPIIQNKTISKKKMDKGFGKAQKRGQSGICKNSPSCDPTKKYMFTGEVNDKLGKQVIRPYMNKSVGYFYDDNLDDEFIYDISSNKFEVNTEALDIEIGSFIQCKDKPDSNGNYRFFVYEGENTIREAYNAFVYNAFRLDTSANNWYDDVSDCSFFKISEKPIYDIPYNTQNNKTFIKCSTEPINGLPNLKENPKSRSSIPHDNKYNWKTAIYLYKGRDETSETTNIYDRKGILEWIPNPDIGASLSYDPEKNTYGSLYNSNPLIVDCSNSNFYRNSKDKGSYSEPIDVKLNYNDYSIINCKTNFYGGDPGGGDLSGIYETNTNIYSLQKFDKNNKDILIDSKIKPDSKLYENILFTAKWISDPQILKRDKNLMNKDTSNPIVLDCNANKIARDLNNYTIPHGSFIKAKLIQGAVMHPFAIDGTTRGPEGAVYYYDAKATTTERYIHMQNLFECYYYGLTNFDEEIFYLDLSSAPYNQYKYKKSTLISSTLRIFYANINSDQQYRNRYFVFKLKDGSTSSEYNLYETSKDQQYSFDKTEDDTIPSIILRESEAGGRIKHWGRNKQFGIYQVFASLVFEKWRLIRFSEDEYYKGLYILYHNPVLNRNYLIPFSNYHRDSSKAKDFIIKTYKKNPGMKILPFSYINIHEKTDVKGLFSQIGKLIGIGLAGYCTFGAGFALLAADPSLVDANSYSVVEGQAQMYFPYVQITCSTGRNLFWDKTATASCLQNARDDFRKRWFLCKINENDPDYYMDGGRNTQYIILSSFDTADSDENNKSQEGKPGILEARDKDAFINPQWWASVSINRQQQFCCNPDGSKNGNYSFEIGERHKWYIYYEDGKFNNDSNSKNIFNKYYFIKNVESGCFLENNKNKNYTDKMTSNGLEATVVCNSTNVNNFMGWKIEIAHTKYDVFKIQ